MEGFGFKVQVLEFLGPLLLAALNEPELFRCCCKGGLEGHLIHLIMCGIMTDFMSILCPFMWLPRCVKNLAPQYQLNL